MKTIIAGSRGVHDYQQIRDAMDAAALILGDTTCVISGTAAGVDRLGEHYAFENGLPIKRFPANWNKFGKRAGYLRNQQMAEEADALVAVWDGVSRGTRHMIDIARCRGLLVLVWTI